MVMVVICWIGGPVLFNPFPSYDALTYDISEMVSWLRNPLPTTKDIAFLLFEVPFAFAAIFIKDFHFFFYLNGMCLLVF